MKTVTLLSLFVCAFFFKGYSQDVKPGSISTHLADFKGSTSVDFSTGILNYNIPLFTIQQDGFQLPVSMGYNAQGIKCDETPGLSGLGWALDYGTCSITRTLRGSAADEDLLHGILYFPIPADSAGIVNQTELINSGKSDGESDIFTLNVHGQIVKFILQKSGTQLLAKPLHKTDVSIQCIYQSYVITGWNIIDGTGNLYELSASQASNVYVGNNTPGSSYFQPLITSWFVTRIKLLNNDEIRFEYEDYDYVERHTSFNKTLMNYNSPMYVPNINDPVLKAQLASIKFIDNAQLKALQQQLDFLTQNFIRARQTARDPVSLENEGLNTLNNNVVAAYKDDITWAVNQLNYAGATTHYNENLEASSILAQLYATTTKSSDSSFSGQENIFVNKLLKKIIFRNGEIDISYKKISNDWYVYSRIEQKNLSDERIFSLLFEVTKSGYLKSVQLLNKADQVNKAYAFTYYDENVDNPNNGYYLQYSRDYWGYYNGKTTNTMLMPTDFLYLFYNKDRTASLSVFSMMSNGGGNADRKPDTAWTKARSLQSIVSEKGDKISFEYEANEVYAKDLDSNILMGGLRIKSVTFNDGIKDRVTRYKYKFALLSDPTRQRSTGRLNEWEQTSFGWNYFYNSNQGIDSYSFSDPIYLGTLFDDNSNNGVLYHYVEVVSPDNSSVGYKYPEVYPQLRGNYPIEKYPWPHNSELDKALLATIYYNKDGRIVKVDRNSYAYPTQMLGNRVQEFSLLKNSYNYFVDEGSVQPAGIVQIKKEPVHFNQADLLQTYPNSVDPNQTISFGSSNYFFNPYSQIYLPNYPQRLIHNSYAIKYNLPLQSALLLRQQQSLLFGDYDISHAYDSANYAGLPAERAYLYERLINYNSAPRVTTAMDYTYNNFLYPATIKTTDSKQNVRLKRTKYVSDYQLPSSSPISVLQQQHNYQAVVESQSWKSLDNGNSFLLVNGDMNEFAISTMDTSSHVFPVTEYRSNNAQPANLPALGYTETPFSSIPYTTVFWEGKNLYKEESYYHWSMINASSRMDQKSDRANYGKTVTKYSPYTGAKIFTGTNCTYDGIIASDQSPFLVHGYYAGTYGKFLKLPVGLYLAKNYTYEYLSTKGYVQLQSPYFDISAFDNVEIATAALNQLNNFGVTWNSNYQVVANLPLYVDIVKLLNVIAGKQPVDSFSKALGKYTYDYMRDAQTGYQTITLFQSNLASKGVAIGLIEAYFYNLYNAFRTTLSSSPGLLDYSLYEKLFSGRRNVLDYVGMDPVTFTTQYKTYEMGINSSVLANRFVNMYFVANLSSVSVRAAYTDGTYSSYQTINFSGNDTIKRQTVDLYSFPNYQSIKTLQFNVSGSELANSLYYFCIVPSNTPFKAYAYLPDGNIYLSFDQNGQYNKTFYNSFNEQYFEKNTKEEILSVDTLVYPNRNMPVTKMLKITLNNNYSDQAYGINPQIVSLSVFDSTRFIILPDISLGVVPSEVRNIEIPSSKYHITVNVSAIGYTLKINGVTIPTSSYSTGYDIDASNLTSLNITIQP